MSENSSVNQAATDKVESDKVASDENKKNSLLAASSGSHVISNGSTSMNSATDSGIITEKQEPLVNAAPMSDEYKESRTTSPEQDLLEGKSAPASQIEKAEAIGHSYQDSRAVDQEGQQLFSAAWAQPPAKRIASTRVSSPHVNSSRASSAYTLSSQTVSSQISAGSPSVENKTAPGVPQSPPKAEKQLSPTKKTSEENKLEGAKSENSRSSADPVIHVVFGPGGGPVQMDEPPPPPAEHRHDSEVPLTATFKREDAARLVGLAVSTLADLRKHGIVTQSGIRKGRAAYTFADLVQLRAAKVLIAKNVSRPKIAQAMSFISESLPHLKCPLSQCRFVWDGAAMRLNSEEDGSDLLTGQMYLELSDIGVSELHTAAVAVLRPQVGRERQRAAYEIYQRASRLDEDPSTMNEAEELYRQSLELDPNLTIALTNLGNIRFRRHDIEAAEGYYRRALALDERQPEAQYNLGYVLLERGMANEAAALFEGAIECDPNFADAYFNLAMAYEQSGQVSKARPFWSAYIRLEPHGTWTEIAKRHLH